MDTRKNQSLLGFLETWGDSLCLVYNLIKVITKRNKRTREKKGFKDSPLAVKIHCCQSTTEHPVTVRSFKCLDTTDFFLPGIDDLLD